MNPAIDTSRSARAERRRRQSATQPPSSVPMSPPSTITPPESVPAWPTLMPKRRVSSVGSQYASAPRTKNNAVCDRMVHRRLAMRSKPNIVLTEASVVRSRRGPRSSAEPRSGSRRRNARMANTTPGAALAKNAARHPKLVASSPPPAKPRAMPNAEPADQIDMTRPRRWRGKKSPSREVPAGK